MLGSKAWEGGYNPCLLSSLPCPALGLNHFSPTSPTQVHLFPIFPPLFPCPGTPRPPIGVETQHSLPGHRNVILGKDKLFF